MVRESVEIDKEQFDILAYNVSAVVEWIESNVDKSKRREVINPAVKCSEGKYAVTWIRMGESDAEYI